MESLGPSNDKGIPLGELQRAHRLAKQHDATILANRAFYAATPEQKRVIIAKDVLKWLGSGKLKASAGNYFVLSEPGPWGSFDNVNGYTCSACAVGGAAATLVDRVGGIHEYRRRYAADAPGGRLEDVRDVGVAWKTILAPFFERSQSILMECAFEMDTSFGHNEDVQPLFTERQRAKQFGAKYEGATERMRAIYQNIIDNQGTFIP